MRCISVLLILAVSVLGTFCTNEVVDDTADFKFGTTDKEANKIHLSVTIRYRLENGLQKKLESKYGQRYKDRFLLPVISTVCKKVLEDYSPGDIYSYKRDSIEQELGAKMKTTFADQGIEVTAFLIRSVGLSDTLMRRLEKEHIEQLSKETLDEKR